MHEMRCYFEAQNFIYSSNKKIEFEKFKDESVFLINDHVEKERILK